MRSFLIFCCVSSLAVSESVARDTDPEVKAAIDALGSKNEPVRDRARLTILELGKTAQPGLGAAFRHKNDRIRRSTRELWGQIEVSDWARPVGSAVDPESSLPLVVVERSAGITMVFVKPGEFLLGAPFEDKLAAKNERPARMVRMTQPFYLGRYEVTRGEWFSVMAPRKGVIVGNSRLPIMNVRTEIEQFLAKTKLRLPTEAEWEYACKTGRTKVVDAWHRKNSSKQPHEVGLLNPNALGIHDMLGNVAEWCSDFYSRYSVFDVGPNPKGPRTGWSKARVFRGGCFSDRPRRCRPSARRSGGYKVLRSVGFRVARTP